MIERRIPKDIMKFETKLIGGLTSREFLCYVPGAIISVATFFLTRAYIGELAVLLGVCIGLPFFLCGGLKMYGVPFEKFIGTICRSTIIEPSIRRYKSECLFNEYLDTEKECYHHKLDKDCKKLRKVGKGE